MAGGVSFEITIDNTDQIKEATQEAIDVALEAVGLQVEGYAKAKAPVDTGLLRNSITHAVSGQPWSVRTYHATYGIARNDKNERVSASSKKAGSVGIGSYSGKAPSGTEGERAVYIGTNVNYAPYQEYGAGGRDAQPFLRPAVLEHTTEYAQIIKEQLERIMGF